MKELQSSASPRPPFLRWAGSKRQLVPVLAAFWNGRYTRYLEPFAGSACLFFHLAPRRAVLGDINGHLMHTFKQVRVDPAGVSAALSGMRRSKKTYYQLRGIDPESLGPAQRAARFIYLNRFCFNGLYRTNRAGAFNVPYGGWRTGHLPEDEVILRCSEVLSGARLVTGDFEQVLKQAIASDFVYVDPPFSLRARRVFREYDAAVFGPSDLERLRSWLERLNAQGVHFLVSYASSQEASYLARGFYTVTVRVRRYIAGFTGSRVATNEILITNRTATS